MTAFVVLGVIGAIAGLALLGIAIRNRGDGEDPRNNAMLIGGTMLTAFGVVIAGFAIAYNAVEPLDMSTAGAAR